MNRDDYENYLLSQETGNLHPFIMSVYDFVEEYAPGFFDILPTILNNERRDENTDLIMYFENSRERLHKDKISENIKEYRPAFLKYDFIYPIHGSLSANVNQYISMRNKDVTVRDHAVKFLKVLCSMYCFSRTMVFVNELQDIMRGRSDKQVVLAVGTTKMGDGIYRSVKEEIDAIWETACKSKKACVIPELACTFGVFNRLMEKFEYSIVHVAGHGYYDSDDYYLEFLDQPVDLPNFINSFQWNTYYAILNCCYSYSFANSTALPCSKYTISHQDPVGTYVARDLAKDFYDKAWNQGERYSFAAAQVIATANSLEIYPQRYWFLKSV